MKKRAVSLISVIMVAILTVASSFAWLGRIFGDIDFTKGLIGSTETAYLRMGTVAKKIPTLLLIARTCTTLLGCNISDILIWLPPETTAKLKAILKWSRISIWKVYACRP